MQDERPSGDGEATRPGRAERRRAELGIVLPSVLTAALIGWVVAGHARRTHAEEVAAAFMARLQRSQQAFRTATGGFAGSLDSLVTPCPSGSGPWLAASDVDRLREAGYEIRMRGSDGAPEVGLDCHGRPMVADYYAGVAPAGSRAPGLRAYGSTATGQVFVFVDGVAPTERDMGPGGLAIPLEQMAGFRIP